MKDNGSDEPAVLKGKVLKKSAGRPRDSESDIGGLELLVEDGLTAVEIYYEGNCEVGDIVSYKVNDVKSPSLEASDNLSTKDGFWGLQETLERYGRFEEATPRIVEGGLTQGMLEGLMTKQWTYTHKENTDAEIAKYVENIVHNLNFCVNVQFYNDEPYLVLVPLEYQFGAEHLYKIAMMHERIRWKISIEGEAIKGQKFNTQKPESITKRAASKKATKKLKLKEVKNYLESIGCFPENTYSSQRALADHIFNTPEISKKLGVQKRAISGYLKEIYQSVK